MTGYGKSQAENCCPPRNKGICTGADSLDTPRRAVFPSQSTNFSSPILDSCSRLPKHSCTNTFPYSLHDDIRTAAGFPAEFLVRESPGPPYGLGVPRPSARPRDRSFRHDVLHAYDCCCAVCGFDLRLEDELLGLEAAHIKWHSAGGPSKVPNGLALCSIHHKALDRGALGLAPVAGEFKVLISSKVHGESDATRWFWDCHDAPLRHPRSSEFNPKTEFVKWHIREVFRSPPRDSPSQPARGNA